jgi:hypothetical protein
MVLHYGVLKHSFSSLLLHDGLASRKNNARNEKGHAKKASKTAGQNLVGIVT